MYEDRGKDKTIFLLHGTGGNERDLLPLVSGVENEFNVVGLLGNVREHGMPRFFTRFPDGSFDAESIKIETEKLNQFLEAWYEENEISAENCIFVGYSNGANMILATLFSYPELINRAVVLHGMKPFDPAEIELNGTKILLTMGEQDPLITYNDSRKVSRLLEELGAEVEVVVHAGGHEIRPEEVRGLEKFLLE